MAPQDAGARAAAQSLRYLVEAPTTGRRSYPDYIAGTTSLMKRSAFSSDARADIT